MHQPKIHCIKKYCYFLIVTPAFHFTAAAQTADELYKSSFDFLDKKDFNGAQQKILAALKLDSTKAEYYFVLARAQEGKKEYQEAFNTLTHAIEIDPKNYLVHDNRGTFLQKVREFELAISDYSNAITVAKEDSIIIGLLVNRSSAKISVRDFQGAYEDLMRGYKIDSNNLATLNNLAMISDELGRGDETLKYLFRVIKIDPKFAGAYGNIGFKYQLMGDHKKAIQYFNKVLELDPNEALGYSNRSYSRLKTGDLQGAMKDIDKSIELYPGNSWAYRNKALIYLQLKQTDKACEQLQMSLQQGFTDMYGEEVENLKKTHCAGKTK